MGDDCTNCKYKTEHEKMLKYEKFLSRRCRELDDENIMLIGNELSDFPESRFKEDDNNGYKQWLEDHGWVKHIIYSKVFEHYSPKGHYIYKREKFRHAPP